MRTTHINNDYRASFGDNTLFIFNDKEDKTILKVTNVIPSSEELAQRNFDSLEEYFNVEIRRMIEEEIGPLKPLEFWLMRWVIQGSISTHFRV
jgi:hypothetical protein